MICNAAVEVAPTFLLVKSFRIAELILVIISLTLWWVKLLFGKFWICILVFLDYWWGSLIRN